MKQLVDHISIVPQPSMMFCISSSAPWAVHYSKTNISKPYNGIARERLVNGALIQLSASSVDSWQRWSKKGAISRGEAGQFLTPEPLCKLIVQMTLPAEPTDLDGRQPTKSPKEIAEALTKRGVKVTAGYVSTIKSALKRKTDLVVPKSKLSKKQPLPATNRRLNHFNLPNNWQISVVESTMLAAPWMPSPI